MTSPIQAARSLFREPSVPSVSTPTSTVATTQWDHASFRKLTHADFAEAGLPARSLWSGVAVGAVRVVNGGLRLVKTAPVPAQVNPWSNVPAIDGAVRFGMHLVVGGEVVHAVTADAPPSSALPGWEPSPELPDFIRHALEEFLRSIGKEAITTPHEAEEFRALLKKFGLVEFWVPDEALVQIPVEGNIPAFRHNAKAVASKAHQDSALSKPVQPPATGGRSLKSLRELKVHLEGIIAARVHFERIVGIIRDVTIAVKTGEGGTERRRSDDQPLQVHIPDQSAERLVEDFRTYLGLSKREIDMFLEQASQDEGLPVTDELGNYVKWVDDILARYESVVQTTQSAIEIEQARVEGLNAQIENFRHRVETYTTKINSFVATLTSFREQLASSDKGISPLFVQTFSDLIGRLEGPKKRVAGLLRNMQSIYDQVVSASNSAYQGLFDQFERQGNQLEAHLNSIPDGETTEGKILLRNAEDQPTILLEYVQVLNDIQQDIGSAQQELATLEPTLNELRERLNRTQTDFGRLDAEYNGLTDTLDEEILTERHLALLDRAKVERDEADHELAVATLRLGEVWDKYLQLSKKIDRLRREYDDFLNAPELFTAGPTAVGSSVESLGSEVIPISPEHEEKLDWDQLIEDAREHLDAIEEADANIGEKGGNTDVSYAGVFRTVRRKSQVFPGYSDRLDRFRRKSDIRQEGIRSLREERDAAERELFELSQLLSRSNPHRTGDIIEALRWERDRALEWANKAGSSEGRP